MLEGFLPEVRRVHEDRDPGEELLQLLADLPAPPGEGEPSRGFSAEKIRTYFLTNPLERGEDAYMLLL